MEKYGWTWEQALDTTLEEYRWMAQGAEEIDKRFRYGRMRAPVREMAEKVKEAYGTF